MKKLSLLFSVLIPLLAIILIILTVYLASSVFSGDDLYNLAISLLVILISGTGVFAVFMFTGLFGKNKD